VDSRKVSSFYIEGINELRNIAEVVRRKNPYEAKGDRRLNLPKRFPSSVEATGSREVSRNCSPDFSLKELSEESLIRKPTVKHTQNKL